MYKHMHLSKTNYALYPTAPHKYGATSQEQMPQDTSPPAAKNIITRIQQVVASILYYSRAVDSTILMALFIITSEQE